MSDDATIVVRGMPPSLDQRRLERVLQQYGSIVRATWHAAPSPQHAAFSFVSFATTAQAAHAVRAAGAALVTSGYAGVTVSPALPQPVTYVAHALHEEEAANFRAGGVLPWRRRRGGAVEVLLGAERRKSEGRVLSFCAGKREGDEAAPRCGAREFAEECGVLFGADTETGAALVAALAKVLDGAMAEGAASLAVAHESGAPETAPEVDVGGAGAISGRGAAAAPSAGGGGDDVDRLAASVGGMRLRGDDAAVSEPVDASAAPCVIYLSRAKMAMYVTPYASVRDALFPAAAGSGGLGGGADDGSGGEEEEEEEAAEEAGHSSVGDVEAAAAVTSSSPHLHSTIQRRHAAAVEARAAAPPAAAPSRAAIDFSMDSLHWVGVNELLRVAVGGTRRHNAAAAGTPAPPPRLVRDADGELLPLSRFATEMMGVRELLQLLASLQGEDGTSTARAVVVHAMERRDRSAAAASAPPTGGAAAHWQQRAAAAAAPRG